MKEKGFAIALAWPEMYCKQTGAWYDDLSYWLGISKNRFYKVGHAAVVLVDPSGKCHYYDFGRYHAPYGYGRVRSAEADHDLRVNTLAQISKCSKKILNFNDLSDKNLVIK